jgi:hypothetical protein
VRALALSLLLLTAVAQASEPTTGALGMPAEFLDVPFVGQDPLLCGGAAATMVLRYWGDRATTPTDFAGLVDARAGGIRPDDLVVALRDRGWRTHAFAGTAADLAHHLQRRRPVVVLVATGTDRFHYVVVVGWHRDQVIVHDPRRGSFRVEPWAAFDASWAAAGHWSLLILPWSSPESDPAGAQVVEPAMAAASLADALQRAAALAAADSLSAAEAHLQVLAARWPQAAPVWRELAGLRFRQQRYQDASQLAAHAVALDPNETHAWRILGASRYLLGDTPAALAAWNRTDRPRLDAASVEGLSRTRPDVVTRMLGVGPGDLVTPRHVALARRRLAELPALDRAHLDLRPLPGGDLRLDASVLERRDDLALPALLAKLPRAMVHEEAGFAFASPTGAGEMVTLSGRWEQHRPRLAALAALPLPGQPGVILATAVAWERQTYAASAVSDRRRGEVSLRWWSDPTLVWEAGLAVDRWDRRDVRPAVRGAGEWHPTPSDRAELRLGGEVWPGPGAFAVVDIGLRSLLMSRPHASLVAASGWRHATGSAPTDLWPGAGAELSRGLPLRAHPLLDDGIVTGSVFGRSLVHATAEVRHRLFAAAPGRFDVAAFADGAAVAGGRPARGSWQLDAGVGLRLGLLRQELRLDLGRGLRDGATAVTLTWAP